MRRQNYARHHLLRSLFTQLGRHAWKLSFRTLKLGLVTFSTTLRFLLRALRQLIKHFLSLPPRGRIISAGVVLAAIGLMTVLALLTRPQKFELKFVRDYGGAYAYTGDIPGASMKTSLGIKDDAIAVKVERQETSIEFITPFASSSIKKEANADISYSNKIDETSYHYKLTETGLKEDIVFKKKPAKNHFTSVMRVSGLVINKTSDGLPVFSDRTGNYQFHFARPYAVDAAGNRTYGVKYSLSPTEDRETVLGLTSKKTGRQIVSGLGKVGDTLTASTYSLVLEVDEAWLSDPKRIYPVTIDPTITHNTTATFATGQLNRIQDTGSGSNPNLTTYYQEVPVDPFTSALWHFNETANDTCSGGQDACDSSGNGNHGTATGTTINTTSQQLGAAARTFNGSSDYILVTDSTYVDFTGDLTIEMWLKPGSTQLASADILSKHGNGAYTLEMTAVANSNAYFFAWDTNGFGGYTCTGTTVTLTANVWQHLAIIKSGAVASYYINGNFITSCVGSSATIVPNGLNLSIGSVSSGGSRWWNGSMDEIRLSNFARSAEEIRMSAQRRPYGVYTSPVMDLTKATAFTSLSWDERGVTTGDGETASSSTSLVAEWKFNETSGTTAASGGSCGATCNGTLTTFASTGSQDAAAGTGWTVANKRWGAGALMFDGTNDTVSMGNPAPLQITGALTMEAWVKTSAGGTQFIVSKRNTDAAAGMDYDLEMTTTGQFYMVVSNGTTAHTLLSNGKISDGKWHYIVGTYVPSTSVNIYLDGVLDNSLTTGVISSLQSVNNFFIGSRNNGAFYFRGVIDVVRIYSRALPAHEILSNYNAANMEFETRVGSTTTADDGTWEAWKPVTSETQLDSLDTLTPNTSATLGIYSTSTEWALGNPGGQQDWNKYNNAFPSTTCDYTGGGCNTDGRIFLGSSTFADAKAVINPSVIKDDGIYKMWYSGLNNAETAWGVLYATSPDGLTWTKLNNSTAPAQTCDSGGGACTTSSTGALEPGSAGKGDDSYVYHPRVIKDGNTYKMWYTGASGGIARIFYATSTDGITWTKQNNAILAASDTTGTDGRIPVGSTAGRGDLTHTHSPSVIKDGNTYKMWYNGYNSADPLWRIYYATSPDGLTWTKQNNQIPTASNTQGTDGRLPVGTSGADGSALAGTGVLYPHVIKDGNIYKMWYTGFGTDNVWRILYATSPDGLTWTKQNNAIPSPTTSNHVNTGGRITIGTATMGDDTHVISPSVLKDGDNSYKVWYVGHDGTNWRASYYATMTTLPITQSIDTVLKMEGTGSRRFNFAGYPNASTRALWHLDDTDAVGVDATGNDNDGSALNTTTVDGVIGKAKSFNGSSSYIRIPDDTSIKPSYLTISAWFKTTTSGRDIIMKYSSNSPFQGYAFGVGQSVANTLNCWVGHNTWTTGATSVIDGKWHHGACTYDGTNARVYLDGRLDGGPTAQTAVLSHTVDAMIGACCSDSTIARFFNGTIDELEIDATPKTDEEIMEMYRLGRDYYIGQTYSSVDMSTVTKVPIQYAAESLSAKFAITIGESAYANYEADSNTVGLWHLEETAGSGQYIKDSSVFATHGTPTGTTSVIGYLGRARSFNGTSDYISLPTGILLGTSSAFTLEAWINPTGSYTDYRAILYGSSGAGSNNWLLQQLITTGVVQCGLNNAGGLALVQSTTTPPANQWTHVACTYDGSNIRIYINGQLQNLTAKTGALTTDSGVAKNIGRYEGGSQYFSGRIDEPRISNTARSADQIRQAFEIGQRTHIAIPDFRASLSSNLITGAGDLSFTVDATSYGLAQMGTNLFLGDKIIVKESVAGTEYTAQGTVDSVTPATGATTVDAWDSGSTFPTNGFTANASVFKWQTEWFDPLGSLSTQRDGVTRVTVRPLNNSTGGNVWLDDIRYGGPYLTTPTGSSPTSSTGNRYFQYRAVESTSDYNVSSSLVSVTLDYTANSIPATPSLDSPSDTATNQSLTPVLKTTSTDADGDYLRYKIELCTNAGMTTGCQTFDQTASQTGWSGQNTQSGTAYTSGTQATYTVQTALAANTTYYWRSYAIDPGGTNIFSATQGTPFSFTTGANPTAPMALLTNGLTNPPGIAPASIPYFSAIFNDSVGDTTTQVEIQVSTSSTFGSITHWDSGILTIASTTAGDRSPNINYAGATLQANTTFYWRIRFRDSSGNIGAWSTESAFFSTTQLFATNCTLQKNASNTQIIINWTNNNTVNDGYTVEKSTDGGAFSVLTTTGPTVTTTTDNTVTSGHTYAYRVYATLGAQSSEVCTSATLSLQLGNLRMESLQLKDMQLY